MTRVSKWDLIVSSQPTTHEVKAADPSHSLFCKFRLCQCFIDIGRVGLTGYINPFRNLLVVVDD